MDLYLLSFCVTQWPSGQWSGLQVARFKFETWYPVLESPVARFSKVPVT